MTDATPLHLSAGLPETVLPPVPAEWAAALDGARARDGAERTEATKSVAGEHPRFLDAWADCADLAAAAGDHVSAYAFARVGYHRGLDALRAAGWRGTGYVRAAEATNAGFLRALAALRDAAAVIGEDDEAERCRVFLGQLDPGLAQQPPGRSGSWP